MPSQSAQYPDAVGFTTNPLVAADDASLQITDTTTLIFGGWLKPVAGAKNQLGRMLASKGNTGAGNVSYAFNRNGNGSFSEIIFTSRETATTLKSASSGFVVPDSTATFILGWVDVGAGTVNIRINNGSTISTAMTPTAFSDPGGNLNFIGSVGFTEGNSRGDLFDEFFFCKNPPSLSDALSLISTNIYNGGSGTQYIGLSSASKATLGLVSWWGMDETSGDRLDYEENNDLVAHANVTFDTPLVSAIYYDRVFSESLSTSDARANYVTLDEFSESLSLAEAFTKEPQFTFSEAIFLTDTVRTSPLLVPLLETIRLNDWLSIRRNPARNEWTD